MRWKKATNNRSLENRVPSIILNVYQNAGIEIDDDSSHSFGFRELLKLWAKKN